MPLRVRLGTRGAALLLVGSVAAVAQTKDVSFSRDVAPVLAAKCIQCHGKAPFMANLDLTTREGALKGGQHGPAIVPGDAVASHLYLRLTGKEQKQMPLGGVL